MRRASTFLLLFLVFSRLAFAQHTTKSQQQKPDPDRLGLTCTQILQMTSSEWILYYGQKTGLVAANMPYDILNANAAYGKCYDARTDALARSLAKSGKGPSTAGRAEFGEFETALRDFAAKVLPDAQQSADSQKASYANLYEKQFRYAFYQSYEPKPASPGPGAGSSAAQKSGAPTANAADGASAPPPTSDTNDVTKAKNRFGELLGALPEDKIHEVHAAFGEILGPHPVRGVTQLAVYRYAIFLLEPSLAKPFSPPPF